MAEPFYKQFCGASSRGLKVSEGAQDHAKLTIVSDWADGEHRAKNMKYKFTYLHNGSTIWKKTWTTSLLTFTTAQPFCKRFCGASSLGVEVSERVQDYEKRTILSDWANGEQKAKNTKIKVHLPPQWLNRFVNGFVEHVRGVCMYLNKPKSMQNEVLLIENYHCLCTPAQQKLCATAFPENDVLP